MDVLVSTIQTMAIFEVVTHFKGP